MNEKELKKMSKKLTKEIMKKYGYKKNEKVDFFEGLFVGVSVISLLDLIINENEDD